MKRRILLWFCPIIILFLGVGLYAVLLFNRLGGSINVILRENYESVLAGQQMKESSERMDSGLSFALAAEEKRGRDLFNENAPLFQESLKKELNNITLPGEGELANKISGDESRYQALARIFWDTPDLDARRKKYFSELLPLFTEVKNNAQEVIRINQDNMVEADHRALSLSADSTRTMVVLLVFGVALALSLGYGLQRAILKPIQVLTAVSKELGEGKLDQVVPVESHDELGQLADAFNKLAARLRVYRQTTSDQLSQARQMTEITFSAFPDSILALSLDGKINFANPAAGKLLHKLNGEYGLPPAIQEEVGKVLKGAPDSVPTSFEKAVAVRIDDHEAFLLPRVIGMRDESGNLFGAALVLQDVTRFRLMDEVKTNLVSTVSHELKTPLTSIRMGLHLLLEERIGSLNPKQLELLVAAREDSERLLRMINDLLDLARLESGQTRQGLEVVLPGTLIEEALPDLRSLAEAHDARLVVEVAGGLPDVTVDSRQIHHVFSNFVGNAARFTKPGDKIVLSAKPVGKTVRFSVLDYGPGIPKEFQSRVFERFFRIPGTEESNGVGLGLAIAKEIVSSLGGTIGLHSTPGEGSEFYFDLPAATTQRQRSNHVNAKILIVDDETNVRLNYRITLETEGYTIFDVASGARALEELIERSFDLAILDMRMPGMDGLDLLAKMREIGIAVPAMIVTAYSDVPHAVKAMKLGAIDFLQKPLRPEELRRIVAEILKRHAPAHHEHTAESFNSHIVAAKRCLNLRSFAMARIHLVKALELNDKSVEAFNLAGVLAELLDDIDKAKKYYGQAIKLNRNYEPAQQNMRRLFELQNFGRSSEPLNLGGS